MTVLSDLITSLKPEGGLRCRTGIMLAPIHVLENLPNFGARHGLDTIDYADMILRELPAQTQFVSLSADSETERLLRIANTDSGSVVLLVAQFDLALARLGALERARLWRTVSQYLSQTQHGVLVAMPTTAYRLLPEESVMEQLQAQGRVALIDDGIM